MSLAARGDQRSAGPRSGSGEVGEAPAGSVVRPGHLRNLMLQHGWVLILGGPFSFFQNSLITFILLLS